MAILSKGSKPDNFESHNSLELSFTNICGLCLNFVECKSFLESNSPDILALCETNLDHSIDSGNFNPKGFYYSYVWSSSLCEGSTSFCTGLISIKLYKSVLCSWLALLQSVPYRVQIIASHFSNCKVNSYYCNRNVSHSMKNVKQFSVLK